MNDELYSGKNILVTGGLGFIGSNLVKRLIAHKAKVTVVDSLLPLYGGNALTLVAMNRWSISTSAMYVIVMPWLILSKARITFLTLLDKLAIWIP